MSYTALAVVGVLTSVVLDVFLLRTALVRHRVFWVTYAIIIAFQFVTNGLLTGFDIVRYNGEAIIGSTVGPGATPPMFGSGRLFFAPYEDVLFGFTLVLLALSSWVWWGRRGVQREPVAGPPRLSRFDGAAPRPPAPMPGPRPPGGDASVRSP